MIVAFYLIFTFAKLKMLTEDFNSLSFNSQGWKCLPSNTDSLIYHCTYGMDLVQLSLECNQIAKTFMNIPPHFSIQLYVDFIAYRSIDTNEKAFITVDTSNIYTYYNYQAGNHYYYNQCGSFNYRFNMITSISEFFHSSSQLTIEFSTNLNESINNEGYPFRNLQIYISQCHYSCKTCSNEAYNSCLSCFTLNSLPTLQQCQTCKDQQNFKFLLQTQGCLQECPDGYSYDQELVCQRNLKLLTLSNLNQIQPMISQELLLISQINLSFRSLLQCSTTEQYLPYYQDEVLYTILNLYSSSIAIRLKATIILIGPWITDNYFQIKLNGQIIDSISLNNLIVTTQNSVILYQDQFIQVCSFKDLFKIRVELYQIINQQTLNLQFQGYNLIDQSLSWSISDVDIEQEVCSLNCNQCINRYNCNICVTSFYLYKGQCVQTCPPFSRIVNVYCIDLDEELIDQENSKIVYLVKEFYDVSTTQERINELFFLVSSSTNNFGKGNNIYFSYVPDKKVFGGALVWIDAIFKLQLEIPKYYYQVRIQFQVILGDDFIPGSFEYQINNQNNIILTRQTSNPIHDKQIWGSSFLDYVLQVDQTINKDEIQNRQLIILLNCNNPTKSMNQSFCALQNLFITAEFYCTKEYRFDIFKQQNDLNPCVPICGDGYVVDEEQCDDGNLDPFDGCFNCQYQCEEFCQYCIYGKCLLGEYDIQIFFESLELFQEIVYHNDNFRIDLSECQLECLICKDGNCYQCMEGYIFDIITQNCYLLIIGCNNVQTYSKEIEHYSKMPICKSDISYQKLDSNYQDPNYICINCLTFDYQSCNNKCSFCYQGLCFKCQSGYTLYNNLDCLSICGDGIINKDKYSNENNEECDNPLCEGCQNCMIQSGYKCIQEDNSICWTCDQKCLRCINDNNTLLCQQCMDGYYAVNSFCNLCNDNCITCKDDAALCTSCYRDDCQKCEDIPGLYTDSKIKKCVPLCGDGIKIQFYEQCDDGNTFDGDGCNSDCNSELVQDQYSFQIQRLSGSYSNDLSIIHDSKIQLNCQNTKIIIEGFNENEFIYNSTISSSGCQIQFKFFKSIRKTNMILIIIQFQELYSRILTDQYQQYKEIQVNPVEQLILDDSQQSQADVISDAQSSLSLLIWILALLSILFGLFDYLWAVLEILSWINNFYFFNVNFPFNVQVLFLNSDWSSIISFPTYQNLNQPGCDYYFESPPRFTEKGVDPLFINNAQVPIFFIFTSILLYFVSLIFLSLFKLIDQTMLIKIPIHGHSTFSIQQQKDIQLHNQKQIKYLIKHNNYIAFIVQKLIIISNRFQSRIKQTITLCMLDLTMAITLQLIYGSQFQHSMILINNILAFLFCLLLIYQLRQSYYVIGIHKNLAEFPHFKLKYGCYYENININNTFGLKFNFFGLIRKITYIFCIVYFYYNPLIQTTLCFISCSSGVFLLLYSNPFESKGQLYKQIISESGLSLITFVTIILSIDDQFNKMEESTKIYLGWIIISLVILCVLCEILTLIFEICRLLYEIVVKMITSLLNIQNSNKEIETKKSQNQESKIPEIIIVNKLSFIKHGQIHQFFK